MTQESSARLLELIIIALPFFNQYIKRMEEKPTQLNGIMIAEPRSPFENLLSIKYEVYFNFNFNFFKLLKILTFIIFCF